MCPDVMLVDPGGRIKTNNALEASLSHSEELLCCLSCKTHSRFLGCRLFIHDFGFHYWLSLKWFPYVFRCCCNIKVLILFSLLVFLPACLCFLSTKDILLYNYREVYVNNSWREGLTYVLFLPFKTVWGLCDILVAVSCLPREIMFKDQTLRVFF